MKSTLLERLQLTYSPVAIHLTDEKPEGAIQFKEGNLRGCTAAMLVAAATQKRSAAFDRKHFGCPGGGVGLGFGNKYVGFPIEQLLSTGGKFELGGGQTWDMGIGERFFESPDITCKWINTMPFLEVPTEYVVLKPLEELQEGDRPVLVWLLVNPDQLSAIATQIGYRRGSIDNIIAPWGAACQSILFAYGECEKEQPRAVLGFFDLSKRHRIARDILSLTIPYSLFLEMEAGADESFLGTEIWQKIQKREK